MFKLLGSMYCNINICASYFELIYYDITGLFHIDCTYEIANNHFYNKLFLLVYYILVLELGINVLDKLKSNILS